MAIQRTGHVAIRVRDLDTTRRFYRDVLGMKIAHEYPDRGVFFRFDGYHHDLVAFKAEDFTPDGDRYAGQLCHGIHVTVSDRTRFEPVQAAEKDQLIEDSHFPVETALLG